MRFSNFIAILLLFVVGCSQSEPVIYSPDGRLRAEFSVSEAGEPQYALQFDGVEILRPSKLGITTATSELNSGMSLTAIKHSKHDTEWQPVWGQYTTIRDNYNGMRATLSNEQGEVLHIDLRLYNDGLALRYTIEGEGAVDILNEQTEFKAAEDYNAHWIAGSYDDDEYGYMHTPLSGITREAMAKSGNPSRQLPYPAVNTPVTMVTTNGTHIAIHEAALWEYPAMSLRYDAESNSFTSDLAAVGAVKSHVELPFSTPWRTIIVGDRAGELIESTLTLNLNDPCRLEDTSWIRPMKYVGVWWEMHLKNSTWDMGGSAPHCATTENVKRYIDFAAEAGFEGVLVEGWNVGWGWGERFDYSQPYPDFDIDEIVAYGRERGMMLIGHHETYANVVNYEEQMEEAYDYYEAKGVGAVKTGYVGSIPNRYHNSREMVDHYNRTVVEAAKRHITVDIHEPVHPTGICRTYPNLVSAEGMRGQEWQAWNSGNCIDHNPTLPFTRNVAGAMDFTPGIFDVRYHNSINRAAANDEYKVDEKHDYRFFVNSTLAHQLALYVVFYSPIQMVADLPENYKAYPEAFTFIRNVPVDWSDTRALDCAVGDYAVVARRDKHSDKWYVGGITDGSAREVSVALDFLEDGRSYRATIYRDGERAGWDSYPTDHIIEQVEVCNGSVLDIRMAAGGGFAIEIE